jgi:crotonobetainyl-CoA:carnitine CoA-transferase CaiB-like acyl-CoA transferase
MGPCDVAYRLGSVHAAFGTLVALYNRRATGRGDHVDVSLQDVLAADPFLRVITRYSVTGEVPERTGHSQSTTVAETYRCKDGYARIFVNQPDHWRRFVEWLGNPPELLDPKLENVQSRFPLRQIIDRLVEARTLNYETKKFFEEFQTLRLAAAPINAPSAFLADEQTQHRSYVTEVEHDHLGCHTFPGDPYRFSETPWRIERGAPLNGEHQKEIDHAWNGPSAWIRDITRGNSESAPGSNALAGIRVISFPRASSVRRWRLLAEHGAEVISIEAGAPCAAAARRTANRLGSESNATASASLST